MTVNRDRTLKSIYNNILPIFTYTLPSTLHWKQTFTAKLRYECNQQYVQFERFDFKKSLVIDTV